MKIGYLGPNGTFSEEAAFQYFQGQDVEFFRFDSIPDVIDAAGEQKVDKAIVPLENTIEGTINMTIDSLMNFESLSIEGEFILTVSLHLLSNGEARTEDITEVWSISPILTQCRNYIRQRKLKGIPFDSSASAAAALKESGRLNAAAIGSSSLAELLDLTQVEQNIQDNSNNHTRFVIISNQPRPEPDSVKTMYVITPGVEQPGVLSSILNVFSALSINLSWIESRPTATKLGTYRFFLESNNACNEQLVNKAVIILETLGHKVRILGRYSTRTY